MSWTATASRVVGFVAGLFLVGIGFFLFTKQAGLAQNGQVTALISVLVALGIGVIAASLLPDTITLEGKKVKPLGLGVNATGGAGFFIITLIFLFYVGGNAPPAEADPGTGPGAETPVSPPPASPTPTPTPEPTSPGDDEEEPRRVEPTATPSTPREQPQQSYYRVRTYCSLCCPQGPANCPQVGFGQGTSFEQAAANATNQCVANNGRIESCSFNVEAY